MATRLTEAQNEDLRRRLLQARSPRSPVWFQTPPRSRSRGGLIFAPKAPPTGNGTPPTPPVEMLPGITYWLQLQTATGLREVTVTPPISGPFVVRQILLVADHTINTASTVRVLLAPDNDTTALADPTGQDLIEPRGDTPTGADRGINWNGNVENIRLEPYLDVPAGVWHIKMKVHNASGTTRSYAAAVSIDKRG